MQRKRADPTVTHPIAEGSHDGRAENHRHRLRRDEREVGIDRRQRRSVAIAQP
jgi:hypothetical protein